MLFPALVLFLGAQEITLQFLGAVNQDQGSALHTRHELPRAPSQSSIYSDWLPGIGDRRCGKPLINLVGKGNHGTAILPVGPVHGQMKVALPALYCAHTPPHVVGNLFPGVEDLSVHLRLAFNLHR